MTWKILLKVMLFAFIVTSVTLEAACIIGMALS